MRSALDVRRSAALALLALFIGTIGFGCKQDEPAPTSSGYYDGPMKPKGGTSKADDAGTKPASNGSGTP